MTYVDGFVAPVPLGNRQAYRDHASQIATLFREHGALRTVENWGDDVPEGKMTDFHRAVAKHQGEDIVFSWVEWPSKSVRDTGMKALQTDARMAAMAMPFDGQRMIYGGFSVIAAEGDAPRSGYVDGMLAPVAHVDRARYVDFAKTMAALFREFGALRLVDAWGDDIPEGKVTDFPRAVNAAGTETVVFSWIEWASKKSRDEGWAKLMADPRMQQDSPKPPFDGKRMIYGGFEAIFDS